MKKLVAILSLTLLATASATTWLWLQNREDLAVLATMQARPGLQGGATVARAAAARTRATTSQAEAAATSTEDPSLSSAQDEETRVQLEALRQSLNQREDRDIRRARILQGLGYMYPDLGLELGLTAQEESKVFELIATQQVESSERLAELRGAGERNSAAALEAMRRINEAPQSDGRQMAALLGSKYPQWQEYQRTLPTRRPVKELQTVLGYGPHALGRAQANSLITALAAERERMEQERRAAIAAGADPRELDRERMRRAESNRRYLAIATRHLDAGQLDPFSRMLDRQAVIGESAAAVQRDVEKARAASR